MASAKEAEIVPADDRVASLPARVDHDLVLMFERLAKDPSVDVEKLERLIAMQERILHHQAHSAFVSAFTAMQPHIPTIEEDGTIKVDGKVRSNYATNEAIQSVLKPILAEHGFSLSFSTDFGEPGKVKVIGELAHVAGHSKTTEFVAPADTSGAKNAIQALGSSQSYGQRYTTKALLNIVSHMTIDRDDDGQSTSDRDRDPKPGQRKSQQSATPSKPPTSRPTPPPPPNPPPPTTPTPPPQPPQSAGLIAKLEERGNGMLVQLDNGFVCATKDADIIVALTELKKSGSKVEIVTRPSKDPTRFAPNIDQILPLRNA